LIFFITDGRRGSKIIQNSAAILTHKFTSRGHRKCWLTRIWIHCMMSVRVLL